MQYCDLTYLLVFLPIVMFLYQVFPKKVKPFILLIASYIFFYLLSGKLLVYLIITTFSMHHFGLWLRDNKRCEEEELFVTEKENKKEVRAKYLKKRKQILFFGIIIQLGFLVSLKYLSFFCLNVNNVFDLFKIPLHIKQYKFAAPIGISFYTMQAISYLVDVYRGKIETDKNIFKLALYMAFFPQVMEGPIARYNETADSLYAGNKITYHNMCFGIQRILYGLLKKIVIADRLNIIVKAIFSGYATMDGGLLLAGAVLYTIQLYMDFSGVMDVVIGSGEIFGVKLPENFRQPFFAKNISDFWARWHITLGTWFKDYIFYPISLSKFSKKTTKALKPKLGSHFGPLVAGSVALFAVWLSNGIWHGAGYNYIFFGMYHFFFILLGNIFAPLFGLFYDKTHISRENVFIRLFNIIKTVIIVIFGEMFFRAPGLKAGLIIFKKIFTEFSLVSFTNKTIFSLGLDKYDFIIIGVTLVIIFVISILKEKNVEIRESLAKKPIVLRWAVYYALIFYILIFGAYGTGYVPVDPMYASFQVNDYGQIL